MMKSLAVPGGTLPKNIRGSWPDSLRVEILIELRYLGALEKTKWKDR